LAAPLRRAYWHLLKVSILAVVTEAAHHGALDLASFRIRRLIGSGNRNGRYLALLLKPNPHQSSPRFMLASPTEIACSTGSMTLRRMATLNRFAPPVESSSHLSVVLAETL
jgi:hypothetical protein